MAKMGKIAMVTALLAVLLMGLVYFSGSGFEPGMIRNQRVLVTGASSGIGEQLAYQYASLGARLVLTARREVLLQNISRSCRDMGAPQVDYVAADMALPEDRDRVIAQVQESFQGGLDQLILNHAVLVNEWWTGSLEDMEVLERLHTTNFLSYVDIASKALPMLVASRGRIGVVSSIFGHVGVVTGSAYSSCKFALHGFFSSLRQELRVKDTGVSVTIAVLGPVASDSLVAIKGKIFWHLPMELAATPAETARVVLENVAMRSYRFVFNWMSVCLLHGSNIFPDYVDDAISNVIMNKGEDVVERMFLLLFRAAGLWYEYAPVAWW